MEAEDAQIRPVGRIRRGQAESAPPARSGPFEGPQACAAVASLGAGLIHAAAASAHSENRGAALALGLLATAQVGWGAFALKAWGSRTARVGVVVQGAAIGGWLMAKTVGIPFIPGLEAAEAIQLADIIAAALAVLAGLLSAPHALVGDLAGALPVRPRRALNAVVAIVVAGTSVTAMATTGSHRHLHGDGPGSHSASHETGPAAGPDPTGHEPGSHGAEATPTDESAHDHRCPGEGVRAGDVWRCEASRAMLVSRWSFNTEADRSDLIASLDFADTVEELAEPYRDYQRARAMGYTFDIQDETIASMAGTDLAADVRDAVSRGVVTHLVNPTLANDGVTGDPARPEVLIYVTDGERHILVGVMFLAPMGTHGPQVGGPLSTWHTHVGGVEQACLDGTAPVAFVRYRPGDARYEPTGSCPRGEQVRETPEMLHVWFAKTTPEAIYDADMQNTEIERILAEAPPAG